MATQMFTLKIFRGSPAKQYWEEFSLELRPFSNVISSLMEIQKNPINAKGEKTTPVVWEMGCLEEVCGSCSMLINGRPRQACTAVIAPIIAKNGNTTITVAPLTKFPLVRDLIVDRSIMFENLKKVHAWVEVDGSFDRGPGPLISQSKQQMMYALSTCMTCGCCTEACPQINNHSKFIGPAAIAQVRLFNAHPVGQMQSKKRLHPMMEEGGVGDCGDAQNCVRVCPKNIPLTNAIAAVARQVTSFSLQEFFGVSDQKL